MIHSHYLYYLPSHAPLIEIITHTISMGFTNFGRSIITTESKKNQGRARKKDAVPAKKKRKTGPKKPTLNELPPEIILKIFCYTKLRENNLPLVNRSLNQLLQFQSLGLHYINELIENQFVHDLNKHINPMVPGIENLIEKCKSRSLESLDSYKTLIRNFEYFKEHKKGLNVEVFKYKFAHSVNFKYYDRFTFIEPGNIELERQNRLQFLKRQIKTLKHEFADMRRSQTATDVNYDELSSLAEKLFNDREFNDERSPSPGPETDDETNSEYDSKFTTPYIETVYDDVDSLDTFTKVIVLIQNLGFEFRNLNKMMIKIADNSLPFKDKVKVLKYCIKDIIGNKTEDDQQLTVNISVPVILRIFTLLIDSKYNHKCERVLQKFLEYFYRYHNSQTDTEENFDTELWEYVKRSKEADLFHILCGYSTPNFTI